MKIKSIIYTLLLLLLAILLPTACSEAELGPPTPDSDIADNKVTVQLALTLPGGGAVDTRAFADGSSGGTGANGYFEFDDLHVAVFVKQGNAYILEEFVQAVTDNEAGTMAPTWDGTNSCWNYKVILTKTEESDTRPRRLHIIANYPGLTMGMGEEGNLIGNLLTKINTNDENITEHDVYWNCVDVERIGVSDDSNETPDNLMIRVPLVRNFTKVKLTIADNVKSKFQFTGYAMHNVPKRGTVAPYKSDGTFADYVVEGAGGTISCQTYDNLEKEQKYYGNEPYNNELLYLTGYNTSITEPFYMYERSHVNANDPTCIIIRGKYDPEGKFGNDISETYYKLDFIHRDNETSTNVYYNMLRNFEYTMNIVEVKSEGYDSAEEAIANPASNNISGNTDIDEFTNISDGIGRLFVSTTYVVFTDNEPVDVYYKYIPNINQPGNINNKLTGDGDGQIVVTAKKDDNGVLAQDAVVAAADETTGHTGWRKVTLTPRTTQSDLDVYVQDITIASATLQRKITLVRRSPYNMSINAYNPADNSKMVEAVAKKPVNVKVTIPAGIPTSLFPLKFYVTSRMNSIYSTPGTSMYSESYNGTFGFVKEIQLDYYLNAVEGGDGIDEGIKETDGRISFICEFLTNCNQSATDVYVDNEYFNRGTDSFGNPWKKEVTLKTSIGVDIQRVNGRYPQKIWGTNGNNTGTESVTVTYKGNNVGSITIDRDNVTNANNIKFTDAENLNSNEEVVFTFTDNYWHGQWSAQPITYRATATLGQIDEGTTLNFVPVGEVEKIKSVTITSSTFTSVTVANNPSLNNVNVTVSYKGSSQGTMRISKSGGRYSLSGSVTITDDNGIDEEGVEFSFRSSNSTYTATMSLEQLLNGGALNFTRQY